MGGLFIIHLDQSFASPPILPVASKDWVKSGSATQQILGNTLKVNQHSDKAILNWDRFDIGTDSHVKFEQPNTTSIALNRIFQNDPSKILGSLTANGQLYLVNQNGFVFGKNATVDTHTLVASALDISDEVFKNVGITKNFDKNPNASATALGSDEPVSASANITVENGAKLSVADKGRLILAAPTVTNAGDLQTGKSGQILLIASKDKVYLSENSNKPSPGLLVEVGTGGEVTNDKLGSLLARQGNITLAGFAVNQNGRVTATTSTKVNGSIRLLAAQGLADSSSPGNINAKETIDALNPDRKATVNLGIESTTQIIADSEDTQAIDEQTQPQSNMEILGHTVHLQAGSKIIAPGAQVTINAVGNPADPTAAYKDPSTQIGVEAGRVILDKGSIIDLSGSKNITASVERNVVDVPVQSFELRDSPLQKGGVLQGKTVRVDIRDKTPIIDTSGAEKRIERTVAERLGKGGSVNITSGKDVIVNPGASINISGGKINYSDGFINTSKLVTDYGKIIDISDADPNQHYKAVLGTYEEIHQKWGVTKVWQSGAFADQGQFEPGYIQGLDAGSLTIVSPKMSWSGSLIAGTENGLYQRDSAKRAFGGKFDLNSTFLTSPLFLTGITDQAIVLQQAAENKTLAVDSDFPVVVSKDSTGAELGKPADLVLSTDMLNDSGIQKLTLGTHEKITLTEDAHLSLAPGQNSALTLVAKDITVQGKVDLSGGSILLNSGFDSTLINSTLSKDFLTTSRSSLTLGSTASLNVSGQWVNDFALGLLTTPTAGIDINAGSIELGVAGDMDLQAGSRIQADGGAHFSQDQQLTAGKAGSISYTVKSSTFQGDLSNTPTLNIKSQQSAYGIDNGGKLSISVQNPNFYLGQAPAAITKEDFTLGFAHGLLDIAGSDSFADIALEDKSGNLAISPDARLALFQKNRELIPTYRQQASTDSIAGISTPATLPDFLRKPVDLSLKAEFDLLVGTGSQILGDTGAKINLTAGLQGNIAVDGLIDAPAGAISLSIDPADANSRDLVPYQSQKIWLGEHAHLQAKGSTQLNPLNALNQQIGEVLDGGKVSINANSGYFVLNKGASIDVSGTQGRLAIATDDPNGLRTKVTTIGSKGGSISLKAAEGILLAGDLAAKPGNDSVEGGQLTLNLDRTLRNTSSQELKAPQEPLKITITQDVQPGLDKFIAFDNDLDKMSAINGNANISAATFVKGGFDALDLTVANDFTGIDPNAGKPQGPSDLDASVNFVGDVALTARKQIAINANTINWSPKNAETSGNATINTAYLRIGKTPSSSSTDELKASLSTGGGNFMANTQWIDLTGYSQWNGFRTLNLTSQHDLRAISQTPASVLTDSVPGELFTAANVNLTASQIYPSTLSTFNVTVDKNLNPTGQITLANSGQTDRSPLSAGGKLSLNAPNINQNGILIAPFGKLALNADNAVVLGSNSVTSVSGAGQLIPFGNLLAGEVWKYNDTVFTAPPEKKITLSSPSVIQQKGGQIDISGGGNLYAYEFQPGIGGSSDYLGDFSSTDPNIEVKNAYQGGFAVLPNLGSALAPFDHQIAKSIDSPYATIGEQVFLNKSDKLAAGLYTILPARYALLPGAFLVTPQDSTQDQRITTTSVAGLPVVGGFQTQSGAGTRNPRWQGYLIEDGKDIRKHSQYQEVSANPFFTDRALKKDAAIPYLPKDSGQLVIKDLTTQMALNGQIKTAPDTGGRGARLDIAADQLHIVNRLSATPTPGIVEVLANDISTLGVGSVFLGGERSQNRENKTTDLTVTAHEVSIDNGANLSATDLIAAAKEKVTVKNGARVTATGSVNTGDTELKIVGVEGDNTSADGALLRVSSDKQVTLSRDKSQTSGASGELAIESGAILSANNTMLLDATQSTAVSGDIVMSGGSLSVSGYDVNLGEVENLNLPSALNLSNTKLANLTVDELTITGRNTINFFGNVGLKSASGSFNPLTFDSLVLNSGNFLGNNNALAQIATNNLRIENTTNSDTEIPTNGTGALSFITKNYQQGDGTVNINGFTNFNIDTKQGFEIAGDGNLNLAANVNIKTADIHALSGKKLTLTAAGHQVAFASNTPASHKSQAGFGGALQVSANAIDFNTTADLASGNLNLHSTTGNIRVGPQASINLAGKNLAYGDIFAYTPGGTFKAEADKGAINLAAGSQVNLNSGGGNAAGGLLDLRAKFSAVTLQGSLTASAGNANLDVANFAPAQNFDALMDKLTTAGVSDQLSVRARVSDIEQSASNNIHAKQIKLTADQGKITLAGKLNADQTDKGGKIQLFASDQITLNAGATVSAKGTGPQAKGGQVLLSSTDNDNDTQSGITIKEDATIAVDGGSAQSGGKVSLRALRTNQNIAIDPIEGQVQGVSQFTAIGIQKYDNQALGNDGSIDAIDIDNIKADTVNYMSANTINNVAAKLGEAIQLQPGVEINYTGDLTLNDKWELVEWRYDNNAKSAKVPGFLAINATGDFTVQNSLTDGFDSKTFTNPVTFIDAKKDILRTDNAWSYQLTSGSDDTSADRSNVVATPHNFSLTANPQFDPNSPDPSLLLTLIRTGSGDITVAASGDITFNGGSVLDSNGNPILDPNTSLPLISKTAIYSAGKAEAGNQYGTLSEDYVNAYYGFDRSKVDPFTGQIIGNAVGESPIAGGDLRITAGRDIKGALSQDVYQKGDTTPWLVKQGRLADGTGVTAIPTAWGIDFANFSQNVGAFGGGNTEITAGANINDLGLAMPITGKAMGNNVFDPSTQTFNQIDNQLQIDGGGNLLVNAGEKIRGGSFHVGRGQGVIRAGGSVEGTDPANQQDTNNPTFIQNLAKGPQLLLGDTDFIITANRDLALSGVSDPMIIGAIEALANNPAPEFFSYSPESQLQIKALSGNITINKDASTLGFANNTEYFPASLAATAIDGDLILNTDAIGIKLFPSASGNFTLLAKSGIRGRQSDGSNSLLSLPDFDLTRLPSATNLVNSISGSQVTEAFPLSPNHRGDPNPVRIITQEGDISNIQFTLSKKALVSSGRDINSLKLIIQHANPQNDVSVVSAVRDIINPLQEAIPLPLSEGAIQVAGPGELLVSANRNIDLGTSNGIFTSGNGPIPGGNSSDLSVNSNLPATGAGITVIAGLNGAQPNYLGLEKLDPTVLKYAKNLNAYQALVTDFMRTRTGNTRLSTRTAFELFNQLAPAEYAALQPQFKALESDQYRTIIGQMKQTMANYVRQYQNNPSLTESDALTIFNTLKPEQTLPIQTQLNQLANTILFAELNQTGSASAKDPLAGNQRGFDVIEALYPGNPWKGDLNLVFSTIQSLKGGDINLLVPGGNINVGLPVAGVDKGPNAASKLGIIASGKGFINAFLDQDFNVNQSRVFALGGDDISIWSSHGDIDAGRGAKSALAVSDPVYSFDENGNLVVNFPPPVAGSGIRTAAPVGASSKEAGDVGLFAPGGIVNAGEAGIGGNNVTISATAVLGANNIDVGGVSTGVPVAPASLAAGLTGVSNVAANATKMAENSANMSENNREDSKKRKQLSTIRVDLIGFGA